MHSNNEQVIRTLNDWLNQGHFCWLVSIAATWGSSPRPAGSLLVWCQQQGAVGSLSGGCVEDELLTNLSQGHFSEDVVHVQQYGISAHEASRLRLPCGGSMTLILEPFTPSASNKIHACEMVERLSVRSGFVRTTNLQTGGAELQQSTPQMAQLNENQFLNYLGPRYRLILVGANQVAECLAQFAQPLDFEVMVCDPRPGAFDYWPHDFARVFQSMPDDVVREWGNDALCAVVTLSHDPRVDDMALMEALTTEAFYVGAMGSLRTTEKRRERLRQLDLAEAEIARLNAPVGLSIGSKTPAEIALSIAADLVAQIRKADQ